MGDYRQDRKRQDATGRLIGMGLAAALHLLVVVFGVFSGIKYIYPPPPEQTFLIDFSEERELRPMEVRNGSAPHAEVVDRTRDIELVQKSEAQEKGTQANLAEASTVDDFGDVEKYEPEREKPINKRALFTAADNKAQKDTLAAQTALNPSDALKAGHASGNTTNGKQTGEPNAHIQGRSTVGVLPKPKYTAQTEGTVVVTVWVDQYGTVKKAQAGAAGSTTTNSELLAAARNAAMQSHFSPSGDAPALQEGTITYVFKLR